MKKEMRKWIFAITILGLLFVSLIGCGSKTVTEITQTPESSQQGTTNGAMEAPQPTAVPGEDVQTLIQAGLDAAEGESGLWEISEITDMEVLMQLMQDQSSGRANLEGKNFGEERPEMPDGEKRERPDGTMPQLDGRNHDEGTFPEGFMPKNGQNRSEGSRKPGNWGGGMAGAALVVSSTGNAVLSKEDILSQIQLAAEEVGLKASSMDLTEEQEIAIDVPDGHVIKLVVFVTAEMVKMEAGEEAG